MQKFTVIYPPTIDYEYMQQRPQRIMEQFARAGHQVYYINQSQSYQPPHEVEPGLTVVHNYEDIHLLPKDHPVVLWMSWAKTYDWIDRLNPDIAVYDCLDDFADWRPFEDLIIPRVDLITTTAEKLYVKMKDRHPNVVMVKNGCEYEHFVNWVYAPDPFDWPERLKGQKAIGYIGALGHWVDATLIRLIAEEYPIVLIGPEFGMPAVHHPNVYRMGLRDYKYLPSYLKKMHTLVIPFLINDITLATNPIKMYEYLATGKPVITTAMPEAMLHPEVLATGSHEAFLTRLHEVMAGQHQSPEEMMARQTVGKENSWLARYDTAYEALCKIHSNKTGAAF